jgi:hypothetical protein
MVLSSFFTASALKGSLNLRYTWFIDALNKKQIKFFSSALIFKKDIKLTDLLVHWILFWVRKHVNS